MALPTQRRGGRVLRVCDPTWEDPLEAGFSTIHGGRWNRPGSFAVLYCNADERTARANVVRRFRGLPYGPEDVADRAAPELVAVELEHGDYADCESSDGLAACGLPATYPADRHGREVRWERCQPIGATAFEQGLSGVACRSAATGSDAGLREIAHIDRLSGTRPRLLSRVPFGQWYWVAPAP